MSRASHWKTTSGARLPAGAWQPWAPAGLGVLGGQPASGLHQLPQLAYYRRLDPGGPFETQTRSCSGARGWGPLRQASQAACWSALCCPWWQAIKLARRRLSAAGLKLGPPRRPWLQKPVGRCRPRCGQGAGGPDWCFCWRPSVYWRAASGARCWRLVDSFGQGASGR